MEQLVKLRMPHAHQHKFIYSKAKRKVIRAGRRSGKTVGIAILAALYFMKGHRILYAAPTDEQVTQFWYEVKLALADLIDDGTFYKNETKRIIEKPLTKQRIKAKTAWNADTLRGDWADVLILDEFQLMNEDTWAIVGAPMLLDTDGYAIFIYTPPSIRTSSTTKARDPRHASKLFAKAEANKTGRWETFHFTSHDNPHISKNALSEIAQDMTELAIRQEIMAEDIDHVPGALWTPEMIEIMRVRLDQLPNLKRKGIGVDPQGRKKDSAETGIVGGGVGTDGKAYATIDLSLNGRPKEWGSAVVNEYHNGLYDFVVAETNFGGDMVEDTILSIDDSVNIVQVHASRGKIIRGEPISAMSEEGGKYNKVCRIHLVESFPHLEDEMKTYTPAADWSPNRFDAFVWLMTELMINDTGDFSKSWGVTEREE